MSLDSLLCCFRILFACSALYVVDLKKFRETAAGDNLRVFYETLSKDPNSLANLDQVRGSVNYHIIYFVVKESLKDWVVICVF